MNGTIFVVLSPNCPSGEGNKIDSLIKEFNYATPRLAAEIWLGF